MFFIKYRNKDGLFRQLDTMKDFQDMGAKAILLTEDEELMHEVQDYLDRRKYSSVSIPQRTFEDQSHLSKKNKEIFDFYMKEKKPHPGYTFLITTLDGMSHFPMHDERISFVIVDYEDPKDIKKALELISYPISLFVVKSGPIEYMYQYIARTIENSEYIQDNFIEREIDEEKFNELIELLRENYDGLERKNRLDDDALRVTFMYYNAKFVRENGKVFIGKMYPEIEDRIK